MSPMPPSVQSLLDRHPVMSTEAMLAHFVPPAQFRNASLDNYVPNPDFPSQAQALEKAREFVRPVAASPSGWKRLGKSSSRSSVKPGIYLDGGFGVGKTHLLAAMWHQIPGRTYYGTFIEFTALVGVLGYRGAVDHLRGAQLLAIDEFELDDPGDTMVMSRLLQELVASGTRLAATSNTPPAALGEGRFAAEDFLREITALSDKFETIRIDGEDYRKRDVDEEAVIVANSDLDEAVSQRSGIVALDDFSAVISHLATIHPSRFVGLVEDLDAVVWREVTVLHNQGEALRLVALVDRLYDARVAIVNSGVGLDHVFDDTMLHGGYRKKYLRAVSRMIALTQLAQDPQGSV
ncbi:MAG: cell division protein ZapE [Microbacteriaceae bacterium]|nr:cell division protein ZapE [Microbacteriaceae bacterium]